MGQRQNQNYQNYYPKIQKKEFAALVLKKEIVLYNSDLFKVLNYYRTISFSNCSYFRGQKPLPLTMVPAMFTGGRAAFTFPSLR